MALTVQLPPEIEAQFLAQAEEPGLPLGAVVEGFIIAMASKATSRVGTPPSAHLSVEESDRILDEAAALVPGGIVLSGYSMSRESIYTREDER